jgi:glucokinase
VAGAARWLFADVGGTNVRICRWSRESGIGSIARSPADASAGLVEALQGFERSQGEAATRAAIAVALPVRGGPMRMTNRDWIVDPARLRDALQLQALRIVNDFVAAAAGIPALGERDTRSLRTGSAGPGCRLLIGPGTGLGAAVLIEATGDAKGDTPGDANGDHDRVLASEAGHMGLAWQGDELAPLHALGRARWGRLSWERLLGGEGLGWLHAWRRGVDVPSPPAEVASRAALGEQAAREAVTWFSRLLGAFAGDLRLAFGADGGVWLTGGVLDGLGDAFDADAFLQAFDDKGRYAASQREVPVRRVLAGDLAFRGLARIVEGACRAPGVALGEPGPG